MVLGRLIMLCPMCIGGPRDWTDTIGGDLERTKLDRNGGKGLVVVASDSIIGVLIKSIEDPLNALSEDLLCMLWSSSWMLLREGLCWQWKLAFLHIYLY